MVSLLGPAPPKERMPRAQLSEPERPTLLVKRQPVAGPRPTLEDFALAQEEVIRQMVSGARLLERDTIEIGRGITAVTREFVLPAPGGAMRQLQIYFFDQSTFFVLVGTALDDARFEQERGRFLAAAKSIVFED
jgi:hypothetical protein